jgi:hypothetical protein
MVQPVAELELLHQGAEPLPVDLGSRQAERERDVLGRGQRRHQIEGLEDEADAVAAQLGEPAIVELPDILTAHEYLTRGGAV